MHNPGGMKGLFPATLRESTMNPFRCSCFQILSLFAALLIWLAACAPKPSLVVGVHPWVGYEPLYLARELKWLPDAIELRDDMTLAASIDDLRSGASSAACMTLDEMLRARDAGIPLSAALVFDVSAGADAVVARPGIETLNDLAQKRIGFDPEALGALVFEKVLEMSGLEASDVIQLNLPPDRQLEAWRNNEVDAVITYEPMISAFLREGAHVLIDSRQMPDTIIDVLAVRRDRPEVLPLVRSLAAAHFRAVQYMLTHEQDFLLRVSAREEVSPEEARLMLAGVSFPSPAANRSYLSGANSRLVQAAVRLSRLMLRRGLLEHEVTLDQLALPEGLPGEG